MIALLGMPDQTLLLNSDNTIRNKGIGLFFEPNVFGKTHLYLRELKLLNISDEALVLPRQAILELELQANQLETKIVNL